MPEVTVTNAALMADVTPAEFEIGSAVVSYGGTKLGGTDDAPTLSVEPVFRESKCDQNGDNPVALFIVGYNVKVKAKFKEIEKALAVVIGPSKKLSAADFGKDLIGSGKELLLVGLKRSFKLPKAVPTGNWEYPISGTEEHGIEIEFTGYQDLATGVFLEEVAADGGE